MSRKIRVAIDGPSGAGKSTLAKMAAEEFGFIYVDTGAIYRAVGLYAFRSGISPDEAQAVERMLPQVAIELKYARETGQSTYLNGEDVSEEIRRPEISRYASAVSAHPCVRDFLMDMQREAARRNSVVMDGRDIGTVVIPDAEIKIFLTASEESRAKRRYLELKDKGGTDSLDAVLAAIRERDKNDSERSTAPLKAAEDSVLVDTTELTLQESCGEIVRIIKGKLDE